MKVYLKTLNLISNCIKELANKEKDNKTKASTIKFLKT
jgi:hypothetical protein